MKESICDNCLNGDPCEMKHLALATDLWLRRQTFMGAIDISHKYGKSRQYWSKIMKQGKLYAFQTAAGFITLEIYVKHFLKSNPQQRDE